MYRLSRRHLVIPASLAAALLVGLAVLLFVQGQDLRSRLPLIRVGMPREEVEAILGPPALVLGSQSGKDHLLAWVDQFWQVDIRTGPDGRVETIGCVPSDSAYRRTERRVMSLLK